MKKTKVALGLLMEMLIITCLCLVIGLGVDTLVSQPVTNSLLSGQIELANEAEFSGTVQQVGGVFTEFGEKAPLSEITISIQPESIIIIILIKC